MNKIAVGDKVPEFSFICTYPSLRSFADLKGRKVILYFYPKDNTPGCSAESKGFRDIHEALLALNTEVIGVSRDTLSCHEKFRSKLTLNFPLISDPKEELSRYFDVIQKNFFKRIIFGIERTTFLIDENGVIIHIWKNVKVKNHANAVLQYITTLKNHSDRS